MPQLVPAPHRVFKTWSMMAVMALGLIDLAVIALKSLTDLHVISTEALAVVNVALAFVAGAVRLVQQQISATTEQKMEMVAYAARQPVKPGHDDVQVSIDGQPLPTAPPKMRVDDEPPAREGGAP